MKKTVIYLPLAKLNNPFFEHAGDTFRELATLWQEEGLVEVVLTDNVYCWLNEEETDEAIILYDRPTLDWWKRKQPKRYKMALFGNYVPANIDRAFPWIFWPRRPRLMLEYDNKSVIGYEDRSTQSIFLGKIENGVQQHFRDQNAWKDAIENFTLVVGKSTPYPYSQKEYLQECAKAKYGLCLRGYGPKCNREIELMGLGTVPLVAPDVDMDGYFNAPREGVHYFRVQTPEQAKSIMQSTTKEQWTAMSKACRAWYTRNCSVKGSFYQTMRLVETISSSVLIDKPMKAAISVPRQKLKGVCRVAVDTVFFGRPFSGITRVWLTLLQSLQQSVPKCLFGENIEIVLLLREGAVNIPPGLLQTLPFVGVPRFSYGNMDGDVEMLNNVCKRLDVDIFISTYYTYCTTPNLGCVAFVHDMIPERFKMNIANDPMWIQKTRCLNNAKWAICISESTKKDLQMYCNNSFKEIDVAVVHNAFDSTPFIGVDEALKEESAQTTRQSIEASLGVSAPFILVIAGNGNPYKNVRLVTQMVQMHPETFAQPHGLGVVMITNNLNLTRRNLGIPETTKFKTLSNITDYQLGLLYNFASAMIYPSRFEGFGLPVLEAYWSECPVICCKNSGGVPEIAGDGCFYVSPDNPQELYQTIISVTSGSIEDQVNEKRRIGVDQLKQFEIKTQLDTFVECLKSIIQFGSPNKDVGAAFKTQNIKKHTQKEMEEQATQVQKEEGLHIIVQYFNCDNSERQDEYDFCVQANLENTNVAKLHCLVEGDTTLPDWLKTHDKCVVSQTTTRLTYKQAFDYVNEHLQGKVVALMNLDIFLDHNTNWSELSGEQSILAHSVVLCLSRHEFDGEGASTKDERLQRLAYATAQDCWIFRAPIFVQDCEFKLGMLGCDNAIAHRIKSSGYVPINSPNEFKIHHYDVCRKKDGQNFLQHHKPNPERPEDRGYYLLPDYNALASVDDLIEKLQLGPVRRYIAICDVMSQYIALTNPK